MDDLEQLFAREEIRQARLTYFIGVDTGDADLVKGVLAEDCDLDYNGCFTDPLTGCDLAPEFNIKVSGRESFDTKPTTNNGIVTVHQGHGQLVDFTSDCTAKVTTPMTDRLFMPEGHRHRRLTGYGYYHETYVKVDGGWKIKTLRLERLHLEAL